MIELSKTLKIEHSEKFGVIITCCDVDEADLLEDYLTDRNVEDISVRFFKNRTQLFVKSLDPESAKNILMDFIAEFR